MFEEYIKLFCEGFDFKPHDFIITDARNLGKLLIFNGCYFFRKQK